MHPKALKDIKLHRTSQSVHWGPSSRISQLLSEVKPHFFNSPSNNLTEKGNGSYFLYDIATSMLQYDVRPNPPSVRLPNFNLLFL